MFAALATALQAAPRLRLTQTSVALNAAQGSNASGSVDVANSGDGNLNLTVTGSASWLVPTVGGSHACSDGSSPSCLSIQISAQTASLSAGIYVGLVTINDPNAIDAPQTVNVSVSVGSGVPAKIDFTVPQGWGASTDFNTTASAAVSSVASDPKATWLSTAQDGGSPFSPSIPFKVTVNTNAGSLATGDYSGTVNVTGSTNGPDNKAVAVALHVVPQTLSGPLASFGGAVNNASFAAGENLAQGDIVAVFGSQFSSGTAALASSLPLPTNLGNVQVSLNGTPVPLFYTSSGQINIQIPYSAQIGAGTLQVNNNGTAGNTISVNIAKAMPRILRLNGKYGDYGIILNPDNSLAIPTSLGGTPSKVGNVVVIYAIGFGPTSPAVDAGAAPPSAEPLARLVNNPRVCFAAPTPFTPGVCTTPQYAGLAPSFAGLYQINAQIPVGAPTGDLVPVSIITDDGTSNTVYISVQQ
ncbi:MAG: hypothetical protein JO022_11330 [Acidobacteriaceae bacterium]|nr:hypothetical protein [Acidobacteriaceae bacterium]